MNGSKKFKLKDTWILILAILILYLLIHIFVLK